MLTIQFGQCGNQMGHELFGKISKDIESRNSGLSFEGNYDYSESSCERWFSGISKSGKRTARAILVDTERKVIDKICGRESFNNTWRYSTKNIICQTNGGGSGNNWAFGHNIKGKELENPVIEAVRLETEKSDRLDGFFGLLGSAGGTGSGVGSQLLEILRQEYSTKTLIVGLVLPFFSGEVGTQNYNSLLTIAKLSDIVDSIILLENDQLLRVCANEDNQRYNQPRFLQDMNEVACEKFVGIFQPVKNVRNEANYLSNKMAPHPGYKLATIKCTVPLKFTTGTNEQGSNSTTYETDSFKWQIHLKQLRRTLRLSGGSSNHEITSNITGDSRSASSARGNCVESPHYAYRRSIANILMTRGYSSSSTSWNTVQRLENDPINLELLSDDGLYAGWIPSAHRFTHLHQKRRLLEREKFVALITNNSQICEPLDGIVKKAWSCYTNSAFLHRYKEFGLEDDDFLRAFAKVENTIKLYDELDVK